MAQTHISNRIREAFTTFAESLISSDDVCDRSCGMELARRMRLRTRLSSDKVAAAAAPPPPPGGEIQGTALDLGLDLALGAMFPTHHQKDTITLSSWITAPKELIEIDKRDDDAATTTAPSEFSTFATAERVRDWKDQLRERGFCIVENAISERACTASCACVSTLVGLASFIPTSRAPDDAITDAGAGAGAGAETRTRADAGAPEICGNVGEVSDGVSPTFNLITDPGSVNTVLHDGAFSGRTAWSPTGELFGVSSGWWAPRVALALFHPRITHLLRSIREGGEQRIEEEGDVVSLPSPIIITDVPELRKMGLSTVVRRYADREHAIDECSDAERGWVFVQGGRVQIWKAQQQSTADDTASSSVLQLNKDRGVGGRLHGFQDLLSPPFRKRMRRVSQNPSGASSWTYQATTATAATCGHVPDILDKAACRKDEEKEKEENDQHAAADSNRPCPRLEENIDIPAGALLILSRSSSIRFGTPCIARLPKALDTTMADDVFIKAMETELCAKGYTQEISKKYFGKASEIRKAYKKAYEEQQSLKHPEYAGAIAPTVAFPVGTMSASSTARKFLRKCDEEELAFTCRHATTFGGMKDVFPRAREFNSSTRTRYLDHMDMFILQMSCVLLGTR